MNDVSSVPARIVVIGTSKKKLAERFKDLSPERRISRRSSPSSRRSSRPPPEPKATFLHDDYMDNQLYGGRRMSRSNVHVANKRPRDEYLSGVSEEEEDNEEVVNVRGSMPRRSRQIDVLFNGNSLGGRPRSGFGMNGYDYDDDDDEEPIQSRYAPRRRFIYVNRRRFRPMKFIPLPKPLPKRIPVGIPLEERISILRQHNQMPFIRRGYRSGGNMFQRMRPNLKRLQHFVPRDRFFGGRRDRRGGRFGRQFNSDNRWSNENPRAHMTTDELDQELDSYMKSSKHPRVKVD